MSANQIYAMAFLGIVLVTSVSLFLTVRKMDHSRRQKNVVRFGKYACAIAFVFSAVVLPMKWGNFPDVLEIGATMVMAGFGFFITSQACKRIFESQDNEHQST